MNNELIEKIQKYCGILEERLQELRDERQELLDKVYEGEALSRKETKRNKELTSQIKKISATIKRAKEYEDLESLYKNFIALATLNLAEKDANEIIEEIISYFKTNANEEDIDEILDLVEFEEGENRTVANVKLKLEEELRVLKLDLRRAKKRNKSKKEIKEIEDEIAATEDDLTKVDDFEKNSFDETAAKEELKNLTNQNVPQETKDEIVNGFQNDINDELRNIVSDVENDLNDLGIETSYRSDDIGDPFDDVYEDEDQEEELEDNRTFGEKVKDKLYSVGAFLNKQKKKIAAIAGVAILGASILFVAKSCSKDIDKQPGSDKNPDDPTIGSNISDEETETTKTIKALVEKGYNEYIAGLMVQNFDESVINDLLARPYMAALENYASVKDYPINLDYLEEYEQSRTTYNLLSEDAVDFVNRAHDIQELNYFAESSINQIVEVLMAINNRNLFTADNGDLSNALSAPINQIVEKYFFPDSGAAAQEDLNKIEALKFFAREDSDLDAFLTRFSDIMQNILKNPTDDTKRDTLYSFISIYAYGFAGFSNTEIYATAFPESGEVNVLTSDEKFNADAQIENHHDWYLAYHDFVNPIIPLALPYNDDDIRIQKWVELQMFMETALKGPEFEQFCGKARTRSIDDGEEIIEGGN